MQAIRNRIPQVAAVTVAALLLGYLWLPPAGDGTVEVGPRPTVPDLAAPSPGAAPAPPGAAALAPPPVVPALEEVVPGFDGTLVAHLGLWGRMDAVQWPGRRSEPITLPLPTGISLSPDATGRLFAGVAPAAIEGPGQALYVGPLAGLRPAALGVVSAAFHPTAPGRLAWLELQGEAAQLRVGTVGPGGVLDAEAAPPAEAATDHRIAAWGDWGFLLAGFDARSERWVAYLLDHDGIERWRVPAIAAEVSSRGDVLLAHAERSGPFRWSLASAWPDGTPVTPVDWVPPGTELGAAWSPDGVHIAMVTPGGSGLGSRLDVRRGDGAPLQSVEVPLRVAGVSWSHDGRFVLARAAQPEGRNAVFLFDMLDGSLDEVELDAWVQLAVTRAGQR